MNDLRQAAEMALEAFDGPVLKDATENAMKLRKACDLLRQALAQNELEEAIDRGTKAWAGVPDASEWVEELRGTDKPVDNVDISAERVHKTDKSIHEPVAWSDIVSDGGLDPRNAFDTAPPKKEWVGLTDEEIYDYADKFLYQHGSNYGIKSFGKAIEQALKEKNA